MVIGLQIPVRYRLCWRRREWCNPVVSSLKGGNGFFFFRNFLISSGERGDGLSEKIIIYFVNSKGLRIRIDLSHI